MNSLEKYLVFIQKPDTIYGVEVPFCFIVLGKIFGSLFGSFGSLLRGDWHRSWYVFHRRGYHLTLIYADWTLI